MCSTPSAARISPEWISRIRARDQDWAMRSTLTDAELWMIAEVVSEMARHRSSSFDKAATGHAFAAPRTRSRRSMP